MQQLLSALVELGEALVDEDERGEVLLLLQKISPQDVSCLRLSSLPHAF